MSKGLEIKETADQIIITIDKKHDGGVSGSGKSQIIATTSGNISLSDGIKLGLNCYRPLQ